MIKQTLAAAGLTSVMATVASAEEIDYSNYTNADDCILAMMIKKAENSIKELTTAIPDNFKIETTIPHKESRVMIYACERHTESEGVLFDEADVKIGIDGHTFIFEGP